MEKFDIKKELEYLRDEDMIDGQESEYENRIISEFKRLKSKIFELKRKNQELNKEVIKTWK